jgi:DNA polymerase (family X)
VTNLDFRRWFGMPQRNAGEVADLLEEIGRRAAFEAGNPYKAKAYVRAAASLRRVVRPLAKLINEGALQTIPGVGAAIARRIEALHRGEDDASLERMRAKLPAGLLGLLAIPGLRPATILKLHDLLGVGSLDDLTAACQEGKVAKTRGLGSALERKILQGLKIAGEGEGRVRMNQAQAILEQTIAELRLIRPALGSISVAGDLRRACELVSDLRLVAIDRSAEHVTEERFGTVALHTCPRNRFGAVLLHATGSERHLAQLAALARKKGLTLTRDALRRGARVLSAWREDDIYKALGLRFIPPELRKGTDEIARASRGALPQLVTMKDLRGVLHLHTDFSDGANTLEEMADAARARGYAYLGVADHSQSAHYAGGLDLDEIETQHQMVDALNRRYRGRFRILKGIESDILADGALDYPPEVLERFDFVVASVHSRFRLGRDEQTRRIITGVSNPFTTILGHLTGRQLLRRPGYDVDVAAVLKACAEHGVAVEINGSTWRLELDWRWHRKAVALGCMLSINPDAHSISELDLIKWGTAVARKGGVAKENVLNAMSLEQMLRHLRDRAASRSAGPRSRPIASRRRIGSSCEAGILHMRPSRS